ncbi:hypothetical protein Cs7R123_15910 [Catellatospora sp. TT07R-123]|nr:hypothetical protein Cs7R123_15910 [Catellatospora sp. TT07R-123]
MARSDAGDSPTATETVAAAQRGQAVLRESFGPQPRRPGRLSGAVGVVRATVGSALARRSRPRPQRSGLGCAGETEAAQARRPTSPKTSQVAGQSWVCDRSIGPFARQLG